MLWASGVQLRAGSRILLADADLRVGPGERVGLVGRNGAGKTTLLRVLAGEAAPEAGTVRVSGALGYLPQDPRACVESVTARERVLSGRGLDVAHAELRRAAEAMAGVAPAGDSPVLQGAIQAYAVAEERFSAAGGYAGEAAAAALAASVGLPERVLDAPLGTLSGGQRRRVELARILASGAQTLLLDEPTNHLDADSLAWLRGFLQSFRGGLVLVTHDVELLAGVANRVAYLDAERARLESYPGSWASYVAAREVRDRREHRERAGAEARVAALRNQADRMRGSSARRARAAKGLDRRAERIATGVTGPRARERLARLALPEPAPCGRLPLSAEGLTKRYGSLEVFAGVDLAVDRGSRVLVLGLNGAGKTTLLRILAGVAQPDAGVVRPGHGLRLGYYAQEHETLDEGASVLAHVTRAAPTVPEQRLRAMLGAFLFSGESVEQPAGTLSGGERTRLALAVLVCSGANVLLLDEPTNNLDPASRAEVLRALADYGGAVVLVTHDPGAVEALAPERVLLLPDGVEGFYSSELSDLVALA